MNDPIRIVKDFITWVEQREKRPLLYRGLADADWEVESSAYRRIKPEDGEVPPSVFQNYIERLLDRADLQGFKGRGSDKLSDLELLAQLQHNGAATCLIDFTSNPLVALWFACREESEKGGKVAAIATGNSGDFSDVSPDDLQEPINKFLNQGKLWKWTPSNLSNRIVAQNSYFVFGEAKIEERRFEEVRIDAGSKEEIREELREKFGISEESLFSDFTGFALSNAHDKPYRDYTAEDYFYLGLTFEQRGDFKKAIEVYGQAIESDPQYADAYNNRAVAKRALDNLDGAIADYNQAIELNPQHAPAYNNRGIAKYHSGDYQGAITDFDQAINLNPHAAEVYNNRGMAKFNSSDLNEAVADFSQAIGLNPQYALAYYHRGLVRLDSGDATGAMEDFAKAKELDPSLEPPESS